MSDDDDEDDHSNTSDKNNPEKRSQINQEDEKHGDKEFHRLLPPNCLESSKTLSSSAPCAISDSNLMVNPSSPQQSDSDSDSVLNEHRTSKDSAMDMCHTEDNVHSLSCLTDSTEQSAQIPIYMSNRVSFGICPNLPKF